MNEKYAPAEVEAAAHAHWAQPLWSGHSAYRVLENARDAQGALKPKFYACSMLPYPSGKLHMGHVRNYTINDMLARQLRMQGYNVLMPMGWDAFGLPAENAAMKNKVPPAQWTHSNIAHMKGQMQAMGLAIDWQREVASCSPSYYKWNQWLFLKMLEKGIAERRTQVVNWDPVDQTVLANEQVIDGRGWRSGAPVEKREIPGYYLKITDYAEELLSAVANPEDPNYLAGWPERVRLMQENWIGKSAGVRFAFTHDIRGADGQAIGGGQMWVFTTRADTLMGVTFCAVAPEHPLAAHAAASRPEVAAFIAECAGGGTTEAELATQDKKGVPTGLTVTHPLTGAPVDVWVGNYVLMGYGDGAVMGVPAHDLRDWDFAAKYNLPIINVIASKQAYDDCWKVVDLARRRHQLEITCRDLFEVDRFGSIEDQIWAKLGGDARSNGDSELRLAVGGLVAQLQHEHSHTEKGVLINCGELDGLTSEVAVDQIAKLLADKGLGEKKTTWRLRDWGVSRQRYWGTPIPIIHCPEHGAVPVPEADLPVVLPEDCIPDGSGNPLAKRADFLNVPCPVCGAPAQRETDTMDTFVDSSWYFMRYCDPANTEAMVADGTGYWMPAAGAQGSGKLGGPGMDQYIGGIEHAILHLLYARFWTKVMRDLGLVQLSEPFTKLLTQGMVLNHIYSRRTAAGGIEYFWPHEVTDVRDEAGKVTHATLNADGSRVDYEGVGTMSKSKNNGVDPQALIDQYGADTARLFVMFASPPEQTLEWNDAGVEGAHRFLKRVWGFGAKNAAALQRATAGKLSQAPLRPEAAALRRELHLVLRQISHDYERLQYNTVVSGCMKLLNALEGFKSDGSDGDLATLCEGTSLLLRALYPACPHISHALWAELGFAQAVGDLLDAPWPLVDEAALVQNEITLVLQVSGKMRGNITVPAGADQAAIEAAALASPEFIKFAEGKPVRKLILVPGRLVNVVV